ncbi:MAG: Rieske 2Fe-2S domain-containing protein [Acidimicrobiia bacterium]
MGVASRPGAQAAYPFEGDRVFVRHSWYVAAFSDEVTQDVLARRILDVPLVLYRTTAGEPVALQGTCPHRHYPMELGTREGDELVCGYHGFRFAPTGRCTSIPTQDRVPERCRLRSYPVVERWRWIWIWMGDPEKADESLIPDHDAIGLSEAWGARVGRRFDFGGRYQLINDNLLDLTHIGFLHRARTPADYAAAVGATKPELTLDPDGRFQTETWVFSIADYHSPIPGVDRVDEVEMTLSIDFYPPGFHVGRIEFREMPTEDGPGAHLGEIHMFHGITPIDWHSTFYFFANSRDFTAPDEVVDTIMANHLAIIAEDQVGVEATERVLATTALEPEFVASADASVLKARRWIQRLLDEEPAEEGVAPW